MGQLSKSRFIGGFLVLLVLAAALAAALMAGSERKGHPDRGAAVLQSTGTSGGVRRLPIDDAELASEIDRAQEIIDRASSTSNQLASAGFFEQLGARAVGAQPPKLRRQTVAKLGTQGAASMRADLSAAAALSGILAPQPRLPQWEIVKPPAADTLLGYFREAESQFGVPWQDLAAIEFIETRFGRVRGVSAAGAQGPMQFLPETWARYGSGQVQDQRDAILGAARYLVANGAPSHMADALYHYNNSRAYVAAVEDYAGRMREDVRAYYGYYYWQVLYSWVHGTVLLPEGYPKARPVPVM